MARRLRLLFINQYYWPDVAATAQMLVDLCGSLAQAGHEVHVYCSRGSYRGGGKDDRGSRLAPRYEVHRGVHVHRLSATHFGNAGLAGQLCDFATFHALLAGKLLATAGRFDLIISLTTPPLIGLYAGALHAIGRARHVVWVMDLHPDCEFALGQLAPSRGAGAIAELLNRFTLQRSLKCVALGQCMADRILAKGVPAEKVMTIPVWGHELNDVSPAAQSSNGGALRRSLGLEGKFIVGYFGNAGLPHTFDEICEAAKRMADDPDVVFLFIGGGRKRDTIEAFAAEHRLPNMRFLDYLPREQLEQSLRMADVHLVTLREDMAGISVPCKLYGIMAAARPALFIGPDRAETSRNIREAECGLTVPVGQSEKLVQAIRQLKNDPSLRARMGRNGLDAFHRRFSPRVCCKEWQELLESL